MSANTTDAGRPIRTVVLIGAAVLLAAGLAFGSIQGYRYWETVRAEQTRTEVATAATRGVEAMFSYNYQNVDASVSEAAKNLRGPALTEYNEVSRTLIIPGAKEKQLDVVSTVQASGVVSAESGHAVVLVFLNQEAKPKDAPQSSVMASRLRVTLDRDGDRWLLSEVKPV